MQSQGIWLMGNEKNLIGGFLNELSKYNMDFVQQLEDQIKIFHSKIVQSESFKKMCNQNAIARDLTDK